MNLSEKDYIRQKNKHLAKIKNWIDTNNPGDLLIPFSVALEDRLSKMSEQESAEELKKLGTKSALPRIAVSGTDPQNSHSLCLCLASPVSPFPRPLPVRLSLIRFDRTPFPWVACWRSLGVWRLCSDFLLHSVSLFLDYLDANF